MLEPQVPDLIDGDHSVWEQDCLPRIVVIDQFNAFEHRAFWQPMDTLSDKHRLEEL